MSDVFGRTEQVFAGALTSDASFMYWANMPNGGLGLLVTQMQIQYQQPIRRIFEIGPWTTVGALTGQPVYYVAGRPEGTISLSRIAGPLAVISGFYRKYGSICSYLNTLFFVSSSGCAGNQAADGQLLTTNDLAAANQANGNFGGAFANAAGLARQDPLLGWHMNGVVITSLGLSTTAQEMLVTEQTQLMFAGLKLFKQTGGILGGNSVWTEV